MIRRQPPSVRARYTWKKENCSTARPERLSSYPCINLSTSVTVGSFIFKNALRNKRRATLSILSVAVSLFLLVALQVVLREITLPREDIGAALRVAVRNKISFANPLPARQLPIIEHIPGVEAVTPFTWFAGTYKNEENMTFAQLAIDAKKLRQIFGDAKMSEP